MFLEQIERVKVFLDFIELGKEARDGEPEKHEGVNVHVDKSWAQVAVLKEPAASDSDREGVVEASLLELEDSL